MCLKLSIFGIEREGMLKKIVLLVGEQLQIWQLLGKKKRCRYGKKKELI